MARFLELARSNSTGALMIVIFVLALLYFAWNLFRVLRSRIDPKALEKRLKGLLEDGRDREAIELCESSRKPLTRVLSVALRTRGRREELSDPLAEDIIASERIRFHRGLNRLKMFAILLPVMGLLAPLPDFIRAARTLETDSGFDRALYAMGISDALSFLSAGLWMCILLVLGYAVLHFLTRRIIYDMSESYLRFKSFLRGLDPELDA